MQSEMDVLRAQTMAAQAAAAQAAAAAATATAAAHQTPRRRVLQQQAAQAQQQAAAQALRRSAGAARPEVAFEGSSTDEQVAEIFYGSNRRGGRNVGGGEEEPWEAVAENGGPRLAPGARGEQVARSAVMAPQQQQQQRGGESPPPRRLERPASRALGEGATSAEAARREDEAAAAQRSTELALAEAERSLMESHKALAVAREEAAAARKAASEAERATAVAEARRDEAEADAAAHKRRADTAESGARSARAAADAAKGAGAAAAAAAERAEAEAARTRMKADEQAEAVAQQRRMLQRGGAAVEAATNEAAGLRQRLTAQEKASDALKAALERARNEAAEAQRAARELDRQLRALQMLHIGAVSARGAPAGGGEAAIGFASTSPSSRAADGPPRWAAPAAAAARALERQWQLGVEEDGVPAYASRPKTADAGIRRSQQTVTQQAAGAGRGGQAAGLRRSQTAFNPFTGQSTDEASSGSPLSAAQDSSAQVRRRAAAAAAAQLPPPPAAWGGFAPAFAMAPALHREAYSAPFAAYGGEREPLREAQPGAPGWEGEQRPQQGGGGERGAAAGLPSYRSGSGGGYDGIGEQPNGQYGEDLLPDPLPSARQAGGWRESAAGRGAEQERAAVDQMGEAELEAWLEQRRRQLDTATARASRAAATLAAAERAAMTASAEQPKQQQREQEDGDSFREPQAEAEAWRGAAADDGYAAEHAAEPRLRHGSKQPPSLGAARGAARNERNDSASVGAVLGAEGPGGRRGLRASLDGPGAAGRPRTAESRPFGTELSVAEYMARAAELDGRLLAMAQARLPWGSLRV